MNTAKDRIEKLFITSCLSKVNINSKDLADSIIDKYAKSGILLFYYKCKICNSYHTTKKPPVNVQYLYEEA